MVSSRARQAPCLQMLSQVSKPGRPILSQNVHKVISSHGRTTRCPRASHGDSFSQANGQVGDDFASRLEAAAQVHRGQSDRVAVARIQALAQVESAKLMSKAAVLLGMCLLALGVCLLLAALHIVWMHPSGSLASSTSAVHSTSVMSTPVPVVVLNASHHHGFSIISSWQMAFSNFFSTTFVHVFKLG